MAIRRSDGVMQIAEKISKNLVALKVLRNVSAGSPILHVSSGGSVIRIIANNVDIFMYPIYRQSSH